MATSPYTVIYSFGDSLSDAGDAYLLTSSPDGATLGASPEPVSPPYYAETYSAPGFGTLTADVFSNGPVWVQDLANALGLPTPGPGEVGEETAIGYIPIVSGAAGGTDFAIGGSVTGPSGENTTTEDGLTDLASQITNFHLFFNDTCTTEIYTVWSGSNDMLAILDDSNLQGGTPADESTIATDVNESVTNELNAVKQLVAGGAATVLVVNVPDLGVIPEVTALGATAEAAASTLAQAFNNDLASDIAATNFGTAKVVIENAYGLIQNAVDNPGQYGLSNVTGSVYTGSFTNDSPAPTVTGAAQDSYLFFDMLHPTSAGHEAIAAEALSVLGIACFVHGTRVAVPGGERAVEQLVVGELVVTASGLVRPIRWIGRRSYAGRFLAANPAVQPIRLRAGCLGAGLPVRDLLVSPEHAMFVDGVLIPAGLLVDGVAILRERALAEVHYVHIELETHDLVLAEGAASETYLDDDSRGVFHNAGDYARRFGELRTAGKFCAPRVTDGYALEAIRQKLGRIAQAA